MLWSRALVTQQLSSVESCVFYFLQVLFRADRGTCIATFFCLRSVRARIVPEGAESALFERCTSGDGSNVSNGLAESKGALAVVHREQARPLSKHNPLVSRVDGSIPWACSSCGGVGLLLCFFFTMPCSLLILNCCARSASASANTEINPPAFVRRSGGAAASSLRRPIHHSLISSVGE